MIYAIIAVTVVFLLVLSPMFSVFSGKLTGKRAKRRLTYNLCAFGAVMLAGLFMPALALAAPAETADAVTAAVGITDAAIKAIAAAAAVGLAGIGGGLAVGPAASAAIGAMAEDSSTFGKSLIFVALGEGIAIYGLLVSFLILFVL
ncbi:MAG: ATPase [Clostridia bacterium]|nr:ATPase [Clostridia bacterium]